MLEYNADTPSMIIESSVLQEDWFKAVIGDTNNHQANYIQEALKNFMSRMSKECEKPLFVFLPQDEENAIQMNFLEE